MTRYQRQFRSALWSALFWGGQSAIGFILVPVFSGLQQPNMAIAAAVVAVVLMLAALAFVEQALVIRRRDRSTRNQQNL